MAPGSPLCPLFPMGFPSVALEKCILAPAALLGCAEVTCFTEGEEQEDSAGREGWEQADQCGFRGVPLFLLMNLGRGGGAVAWMAGGGAVLCRSQLLSGVRITQNSLHIKHVKCN